MQNTSENARRIYEKPSVQRTTLTLQAVTAADVASPAIT